MAKQTNEQTVVQARKKIDILKCDYMLILKKVNSMNDGMANQEYLFGLFLECQEKGNKYFNYVEDFVGNSGLLGAHKNSTWINGFAEDCFAILESLVFHHQLLQKFNSAHNFVDMASIRPSSTSFANMQRLVVKYLPPAHTKKLMNEFVKAALPIYGFKHKEKGNMSKKTELYLSFIFGFIFICLMFFLPLYLPNPTGFQEFVYRVILALAAAGIGAVLPGFIEIKYKNFIRAGGALAIFVLVYFWNPGSISEKKVDPPKIKADTVHTKK
jgi:hypothetical protein